MAHRKKGSAPPRFQPGIRVRVKSGVADPDFPDIPLGGWAGTIEMIEQVEDQITYEIEWDRRTLDGMHPVYKKRCERDGLDPETMWLGRGGHRSRRRHAGPDRAAHGDQDTAAVGEGPGRSGPHGPRADPRRPAPRDQPRDPPRPTTATWRRNLKFPFAAICGEEEIGPYSRKRATMTVTGLLDPDERGGLSVEDGLVCTGRDRDEEIEFPLGEIEVKKKDPNFKLVSDYAYWFHNWPCRDEDDIGRGVTIEEIESGGPAAGLVASSSMAVLVCGIGGGLLGATIGAALRTLDGAGMAAMIGGVPLGMIGAFLLGRYGIPLRGREPAPLRAAPRGGPRAARRRPGRGGRRVDGRVAALEPRGPHRRDVLGAVCVTAEDGGG